MLLGRKTKLYTTQMLVRIIPLALLLFASCLDRRGQSESDKYWDKSVEEMVTKWYGETLVLPQDADTIIGLNQHQILTDSDFTIVTFIDGTCSACILNLIYWDEFISKVQLEDLNCKVLPYVYSQDKESAMALIDGVGFQNSWLYDSYSEFIQVNEVYDKRFQTFLIDQKNTIKLIGDPILNSKLEMLYLKVLRDHG